MGIKNTKPETTMLKLNLYFKHYANKVTKASDYFDLILKNIKQDKFVVQHARLDNYVPVFIDDIDSYEQEGTTVYEREGKDFIHVSELCVTFFEIPRDYESVRKDLINLYGKKANRCEFVDDVEIENGELIN